MDTYQILAVVGIALLALAGLGSLFGLDFSFDGGLSTITAGVGSGLSVVGALGMILHSVSLDPVITIVVAMVFGFLSAYGAGRLVRALIDNSSDGNDVSVSSIVGSQAVSEADVKAGTLGDLKVSIGKPPQKVSLYFRPAHDVKAGEKVTIVGVSPQSPKEVVIEEK